MVWRILSGGSILLNRRCRFGSELGSSRWTLLMRYCSVRVPQDAPRHHQDAERSKVYHVWLTLLEFDNDFVIRIIIRRQKFIEIFWPISSGLEGGSSSTIAVAAENHPVWLYDLSGSFALRKSTIAMSKVILKERKVSPQLGRVTSGITRRVSLAGYRPPSNNLKQSSLIEFNEICRLHSEGSFRRITLRS